MATKKQPKKDTSPYVNQDKKQDAKISISEKIPWTDKQYDFFKQINDKHCKVMFLSGVAGTSKTILSVYSALKAINEKKVSDLVYLRAIVESSSSKLGFLPGSESDKVSPYLEPLMDKLIELVGFQAAEILIQKKLVSARPINFLRGCQFSGKYIILDEAQNLTFSEMQTFLTRIGEFSKVIICGDPNQSDIGNKSAFTKVFSAFDNEDSQKNGIFTFSFGKEDIVRSKILKYIVEVLEKI
jgi:phosphate starvation-inducible PhoH-like protein